MLEATEIALLVAQALERAGIEYALGGSVATSLQGEPRSTNDVDFAVRLTGEQIDSLVKELGPDFEVDEEALRDAIRRGRSANVFHLPTVTKVDLFVRGRDSFDESEFSRKVRMALPGGEAFVATSEDNLLRKLDSRGHAPEVAHGDRSLNPHPERLRTEKGQNTAVPPSSRQTTGQGSHLGWRSAP